MVDVDPIGSALACRGQRFAVTSPPANALVAERTQTDAVDRKLDGRMRGSFAEWALSLARQRSELTPALERANSPRRLDGRYFNVHELAVTNDA